MRKSPKSRRRIRRNCPHCKKMYVVDPRVAKTQVHCSAKACQAESKRISQAKWSNKNPTYFTGGSSTERSRACRQRKAASILSAAPESVHKTKRNSTLSVGDEHDADISSLVATEIVQQEMIEVFSTSDSLLIGLLCMVTGAMQQEEIGPAYQKVLSLGQEVRGLSP